MTLSSRGGSHVVRDPSLMECTFRPQTNFSLRRKPRPASSNGPKQQPLPAAFDLSEYEDLLARYVAAAMLCDILTVPSVVMPVLLLVTSYVYPMTYLAAYHSCSLLQSQALRLLEQNIAHKETSGW